MEASELRPPHGERALKLLPIDDHIGVGELAELEQLGVGEGGLRGAATPEDEDLLDGGVLEHIEGVIGDVGARELGVREREHTRGVEGDVSVSNHHRARATEIEVEVAVIGMAVVPAHEIGGRPAAGELFAGDPQRAIRGRAGGVDERVVVLKELLALNVPAELDVPKEAKAGVQGGFLIHPRNGLDLGVIGRDARAHEPVRSGKALEHIHLHRRLLQKMPRGVEASGTRADHGDAHGREVGVVGHLK